MVDQRIDHIFFRPGREDQQVLVEGVYLAGEPVDGVYPSDHRAVVAVTVARLNTPLLTCWQTALRRLHRNRSNAVVVESSTLKFSNKQD